MDLSGPLWVCNLTTNVSQVHLEDGSPLPMVRLLLQLFLLLYIFYCLMFHEANGLKSWQISDRHIMSSHSQPPDYPDYFMACVNWSHVNAIHNLITSKKNKSDMVGN